MSKWHYDRLRDDDVRRFCKYDSMNGTEFVSALIFWGLVSKHHLNRGTWAGKKIQWGEDE